MKSLAQAQTVQQPVSHLLSAMQEMFSQAGDELMSELKQALEDPRGRDSLISAIERALVQEHAKREITSYIGLEAEEARAIIMNGDSAPIYKAVLSAVPSEVALPYYMFSNALAENLTSTRGGRWCSLKSIQDILEQLAVAKLIEINRKPQVCTTSPLRGITYRRIV